ncbi:hypothetical protein GWK47_034418 [Chionoecetes opilio]|uniref:Uncharacterized protein n=1 Tax=Chionoecetes opilio TaxID=41210 RepID=A0A8J5CP52_CHIOP|nr:hypothetical protein GWK47_034418 [Chionoecetes opilio]
MWPGTGRLFVRGVRDVASTVSKWLLCADTFRCPTLANMRLPASSLSRRGTGHGKTMTHASSHPSPSWELPGILLWPRERSPRVTSASCIFQSLPKRTHVCPLRYRQRNLGKKRRPQIATTRRLCGLHGACQD